MRNPQGYGVIFDPSLSQPIEQDTFTCGHHGGIVIVKPLCDPTEMGGFCKVCSKLICAKCYDEVMKGAGCTVWEKRMDIAERRSKFLSSVDSILNGEF